MDLETVIAVATVLAKYGPEIGDVIAIGEEAAPIAKDVLAAVTPVIKSHLENGALQSVAGNTIAAINDVLGALGQPAASAQTVATVTTAEQQWMDRASQSDTE